MIERATRTVRASRPVVLVVVLGLLARLGWVAYAARPPLGLSDPLIYQGFAQSIADGRGYRSLFGQLTAYYPPGYPYFLGIVFRLAEALGIKNLPLFTGIVQSFVGCITIVASYIGGTCLGHDATSRRRIGTAAAACVAFWPNLILYSAVYLSETLYLAAFSTSLAAALWAVRHQSFRKTALAVAGVSSGIAVLTRPQAMLVTGLCLASAGALWIRAATRPIAKRLVIPGVAMAIGTILLVIPWTVRNASVFDETVLLSNNGGDNLCIGFHEGATGGFEIPPECASPDWYTDGPARELRHDRFTTDVAMRYLRSAPAELIPLSFRKIWYTFESDLDGLRATENYGQNPFLNTRLRGLIRIVGGVYYITVLLAALAGAGVAIQRFRSLGRSDRSPTRDDPIEVESNPGGGSPEPQHAAAERASLWLVGCFLLAGIAVPVMVFGDARFKFGTIPAISLLAGLAAHQVLSSVRSSKRLDSDVDRDETAVTLPVESLVP